MDGILYSVGFNDYKIQIQSFYMILCLGHCFRCAMKCSIYALHSILNHIDFAFLQNLIFFHFFECLIFFILGKNLFL